MLLSFSVKKSRDIVFSYLADTQKFVSIHPLITRMDQTAAGTYRVHETMKLGSLPLYSFTYPATISSDASRHTVVMRATVMRLANIEMTFALRADGDATVVEESIRFVAPRLLVPVMRHVFRQQHARLFQNLEAMGRPAQEE